MVEETHNQIQSKNANQNEVMADLQKEQSSPEIVTEPQHDHTDEAQK
jgi:hypothetical protein